MVRRSTLRIVICWISVSGYLAACWRALAARRSAGIDLKLVVFPAIGSGNAPFAKSLTEGLPAECLEEKHTADADRVAALVEAHKPDVVIIPGWAIPAFKALPFNPRLASSRFVMAMDTPCRGDWRQRLAPFRLRKLLGRIDRIIVPGERAFQYALQLGFADARIRRGMYGYDDGPLAETLARRAARPGAWPRRFLYVGRYVPDKGIDVLLAAYAGYRASVTDPWPLTCCGSGPFKDQIAAAAGVVDCGFVQPPDQPAVFEEHGAFVIASRYEPWGVAIAEAMAAGLPPICTEACGASVELVRPYWNGVLAGTDDADSLAARMRWMHEHAEVLPEMGARAREAAVAFSAEAWARRWEAMCRELA
jgi:glycosyltransferase involved in cell wall biosynthesis